MFEFVRDRRVEGSRGGMKEMALVSCAWDMCL